MDAKSPAKVRATLLLLGGIEVDLKVAPDGAEVREIVAALTRSSGFRQSNLLHLDTGGGDMMIVPTEHVVALRTSDSTAVFAQRGSRRRRVPTLRFVGGAPVALTRGRSRYPSPALVADDFLPADENARLLQYALAREAAFVGSRTTSDVAGYRASRVLLTFPPFDTLIRERVAAVLPEVVRSFGVREFEPEQIEAQLTAHNQGNFYRVHTDSGSRRTGGRVLTYVYYFCREPRRFGGGGLRIYDAVRRSDGSWRQGTRHYELEPENNRIVFFPSRYHHEVLSVSCPSGRFEDGRFTLNGWIHRA